MVSVNLVVFIKVLRLRWCWSTSINTYRHSSAVAEVLRVTYKPPFIDI
jgi:hypothetical protein